MHWSELPRQGPFSGEDKADEIFEARPRQQLGCLPALLMGDVRYTEVGGVTRRLSRDRAELGRCSLQKMSRVFVVSQPAVHLS